MSSKPPTKRARTEENGGEEAAVVPATAEVVEDKVANEANAVANSNGNNTSDNGILDPLSPTILKQSHELAKAYKNATPYPHGMIHNFCKGGFLGKKSLSLPIISLSSCRFAFIEDIINPSHDLKHTSHLLYCKMNM